MVTFFANLREDCPQHIHMKMKSVIFVLTLFICTCSKATISAVPNSDSLKKPWRIKEKQFIEKFGNNDTGKALINLWFANRKTGIVTTSVASPSGVLFGIPFFKNAFQKPANSNAYAPVITFTFGLLFSIFLLVSLVGFLKMIRFSRKKLYKMLVLYQSGQGLPENIRKKLEKFITLKRI